MIYQLITVRYVGGPLVRLSKTRNIITRLIFIIPLLGMPIYNNPREEKRRKEKKREEKRREEKRRDIAGWVYTTTYMVYRMSFLPESTQSFYNHPLQKLLILDRRCTLAFAPPIL